MLTTLFKNQINSRVNLTVQVDFFPDNLNSSVYLSKKCFHTNEVIHFLSKTSNLGILITFETKTNA